MRMSAPFGVSTKRFKYLGLHPKLNELGSYNRYNGPAPCRYYPKINSCVQQKPKKEPWRYKEELEIFSENLGFKNPSILKAREETLTSGGPIYDIPDTIYKRTNFNVLHNKGFSRVDRIGKNTENLNPGPGSYGYPFKYIDKDSKPRKQWTHVPSFEWSSRKPSKIVPWSLAPNRYTVNDHKDISATLAKVVSKRGPYDCFTGPRDNTTIKNYFSTKISNDNVTWPSSFTSEIDKLNHPSKSRYGKFLKANRFTQKGVSKNMLNDLALCPKDPDEPSPAHYDPPMKRILKNNFHPFNSSLKFIRPIIGKTSTPGPGRYNSTYTCKNKSRESWVFKSKARR